IPMLPRERIRDEAALLVDELRSANDICEDNSVRFSRTCRGCGSMSARYASVACGHAACRECADGIECPEAGCSKATTFVNVIETDRQCGICIVDNPRFLDVFRACGHSICGACCGQMLLNRRDPANRSSIPLVCPLCRTVSTPFSLVEEAEGDLPHAGLPSLRRAFAGELYEEARRRAMRKLIEGRKVRYEKVDYYGGSMQAPMRLFAYGKNY
ncbi:hypothetical protein PRIPAC_80716, partial [Pristionchus pacificus]|uniref:RING-type domain-containing protein n=1 Tax=Pristionchus pacificus TaxID=54126 RepID=A0A2A6BH98_PRIPA